MSYNFEDLIAACAKAGEPFQSLCRKKDGTFQISLRSKHAKGMWDAFGCAEGDTPTKAALAIMIQRRIAIPGMKDQPEPPPPIEEEDPLS